ncbi:MAG: type II toxin-antitoxin system RelE/ParE family toxin [Oscillospiraceae bacterium]
MTRLFIHTEPFRKCWKAMGLSDNDLSRLEKALLDNPHAGDVIEGTGGARKIRITLNDNRGKSGGGRVIYVDIFEKSKIYLLFAYPKNVQENLNAEQKKAIRNMIEAIEKE